MKKKSRLLTIVLTIACIVLISIISFVGVYVQDKNIMKNVLPEYVLAKDLKGYRMVELKAIIEDEEETETETEEENKEEVEETAETAEENQADSEQKEVTEEENKNDDKKKEREENYKKSKKIIEKRLELMGATNFIIRPNKETGTIILEFPEDAETDHLVGGLASKGRFEILDKETHELLMDNNDIDYVQAGYGQTSTGSTAVFINIQFNKEGTAKFKDITNKYVQTVVEKENTEEETATEETATTEEATEEEKDSQEEKDNTETITKEVILELDGEEMLSTYFTREISNGLFQLSMGSSSSSTAEQMQDYMKKAINLSALLNTETLPVGYEVEQNKYIAANITEKLIAMIVIIPGIALILGFVYMIIKHKGKGILASISMIGYVAVLLLALRYCNVALSFGGIISIYFSILLAYLMILSMLKEENKTYAIGKWCIVLIPVFIVSIVLIAVMLLALRKQTNVEIRRLTINLPG